MIRKILFATNLTPLSRNALDYALELAKRTEADLVGAYSLQVPMPVYSLSLPSAEYKKEMENIGRFKLQDFFQGVTLRGDEVKTRLCLGPPGQELSKLAKAEKADLIVVAKHSRSTLERFFISSTTERIVRQSRTPVLVVPDQGRRSVKWKPILCAVDFSDPSLEALRFAIKLAADHGSELAVLHALELGPMVEAFGEKSRAKLAAVPERTRKKLQDLNRMFGAPRGVETLVAQGKSPEVILGEAERLGSDLVIVGKRGNVVRERLAIGATTNSILRAAHIPVIVVPGFRPRA